MKNIRDINKNDKNFMFIGKSIYYPVQFYQYLQIKDGFKNWP